MLYVIIVREGARLSMGTFCILGNCHRIDAVCMRFCHLQPLAQVSPSPRQPSSIWPHVMTDVKLNRTDTNSSTFEATYVGYLIIDRYSDCVHTLRSTAICDQAMNSSSNARHQLQTSSLRGIHK